MIIRQESHLRLILLQMRRILSTCQNLGLIRCLAHFESGEISVELLREDEQDENRSK